jgi:hypothetical protein
MKLEERDMNVAYRRLHQRPIKAKIGAKANPQSESNILTRQTPRFPLHGIRPKFMSLSAQLLKQSGLGHLTAIFRQFFPLEGKEIDCKMQFNSRYAAEIAKG